MESRPTQAVLPLVGLAAWKVIRDRDINGLPHKFPGGFIKCRYSVSNKPQMFFANTIALPEHLGLAVQCLVPLPRPRRSSVARIAECVVDGFPGPIVHRIGH
ncbi:MAG: hypothetical protein ACQESR_12760 [Planctomycetota bacterium]